MVIPVTVTQISKQKNAIHIQESLARSISDEMPPISVHSISAAMASEIAVRSPDSVAAAKYLLQEGWHGSDAEALSAERRWQRRVMGGANQRIAVKSNMEKTALPYKPRKLK